LANSSCRFVGMASISTENGEENMFIKFFSILKLENMSLNFLTQGCNMLTLFL
jgi:hypothetical protein